MWKNVLPQHCDWCPLMCGANRAAGQMGMCGADNSVKVARSALHFWEEPPISGTIGGPERGLGSGSGTIFFSNCNMKCVYCQNYEISGVTKNDKNSQSIRGKEVSSDSLLNMCLDLQNQGAMNINFVTGTHYRSHIISAVREAKSKGLKLPIIWNTSGYETQASISALSNVIDIWLPDFKYADNKLASKYSQNDINNYVETALDAIALMLDYTPESAYDTYCENIRMTKGIIVRHMLLPGQIENSKQVLKILFENFGNQIKYSIMNQYTPCIKPGIEDAKKYPELLNTVSNKEYEEVLDFVDSLGIEDYFWQQGGACSESFIPKWF